MKTSKPRLNKKLVQICLYFIVSVIIIYLAIKIINSVPELWKGFLSSLKFLFRLLRPLILGGIFAYILFPATRAIARLLYGKKKFGIKNKKLCTALGIVVSYIVIIGVLIGIIIGIYFMIGGQLSKNTNIEKIVIYITDYFKSNTFDDAGIKKQIESLNIPLLQTFESSIIEAIGWIQKFISSTIAGMAENIAAIGSQIFSIFVAFILSIYLLYDSKYFLELWEKIFFVLFRNSKLGKKTKLALNTINKTFSGYIRGQLIEALIVAILSTTALLIVGIDYALVIGIVSGIFNLVPYIGPIVGTILAALVGILDGNIWKMVWAVVAMIIVQQIDNNILAPKIVGDNVGLHPVFIMIGIIVGGSLGGFLGMLIVIPILASIKKLIALWFNNSLRESFLENRPVKNAQKEDETNEKEE